MRASAPYPPVRPPSPTPALAPALDDPSSSPSSASRSLRSRRGPRITDLTVQVPAPAPSHAVQSAPPPRWRSREFVAYYCVFLVALPKMWSLAVSATSPKREAYWRYGPHLSDGWIFGRRVDVTDDQYHLFRSHLPLLVALLLLHVLLSHSFRLVLSRISPSCNPRSSSYAPSKARTARARFSATFSLVLLAALHGSSLPKMLAILWANYRIAMLGGSAKRSGGRWRREWTPYATWAFNVAILFANELAEGYHYRAISPSLAWLDDYGGLLPRWHISWNISMLRLVSFNMEYYWASSAALHEPELPTSPMQKATMRSPRTSSQTPTLDPSASAGNYTFTTYLAYTLYPPLYLAGPIMSYPSFVSQLAGPSPASSPISSPAAPVSSPSPRSETSPLALLSYATRFLVCLLTMELVLHYMHVVALKDSGSGWWDGLSAAQVSMVGFWNLIVVWLKLLLPWRLFRLWALMDGISPPENMVRCMANNYSTLGFWRSWHRSYNMWVVRYLYIPLGGSSRPLLATLGVFTFVALWHDLRLRLLVWGWGITLFIAPEMLARRFFPASRFASKAWYRPLCALGGVANVLLMMTANLVGFVFGVDDARALWGIMLGGPEGRIFLVVASACLFVGVQLMFEYRLLASC
ncbi:hypothetical protein Rhopal_006696-T1 [Rhodotorula paludigena]|uniref:Glycerol transporter n=1 Tax=Rhodotorula paludigena TaxID=86838 RepID=A0AAV5GT08_9BASI|nr:hypothetical protein Rhopal_006696-T1 [Rhodotorula paludigena]